MNKSKEPDFKKIEEQPKDWEWQWVNARELYPVTTSGNPISKAKALHKKYFPEITAGKRM